MAEKSTSIPALSQTLSRHGSSRDNSRHPTVTLIFYIKVRTSKRDSCIDGIECCQTCCLT